MGSLKLIDEKWILGPESSGNPSLEQINLTDGSWTLVDPDNLIQSVSFSSGYNTVTWNALAAGSSDYNWAIGGNHRAPRWHKVLNVSGTDILVGDFLLFTSRIEPDLTVTEFNQQVVLGVADDPTSTVPYVMYGAGGYYSRSTTSNPGFGSWTESSVTSNVKATNRIGACTVFRGGDSLGSTVYLNIGTGTDITNSGSRNLNRNGLSYVGSVNVSVMVGVGILSNSDTVPQDAQQRFKVSFGAITYGGMI